MSIVGLLVAVVVFALVYWAIHRIAEAFGLPAPIVGVLDVILVVVAVLYLLGLTGVMPTVRLR